MSDAFGSAAICRRATCAAVPPHLAGRHGNQRDDLYDGPNSLLQVLPLAVRESARRLVREAPELMPEVVDLAQHIEWLRKQVAHVQVNGDRQVREALASAGSCEQHGKDISSLNGQLHAASQQADKLDAARVALLGLLHTIEDFVTGWEEGRYNTDTSAAELVPALAKAAKQGRDAYQRAWKGPASRPVRVVSVHADLFELAAADTRPYPHVPKEVTQ